MHQVLYSFDTMCWAGVLTRITGSIALSYAAHSQLCVNQLSLNGSTEQKERILPGLLSGDKVGALAMSEHSAGSDVVSMKTTAKAVDGGYLLNGTKMWITNVNAPTSLYRSISPYLTESTYSIGPRCRLHRRLRQNRARTRLQGHHGVHR